MKPGNAIEVKNITKSFKVYKDKGHTLKEKALFSKRRAYEVRKVIDGISFEVKKGEAIGLIGHNGCGKSTTLKMLTRIMYPDSGTIEMDGRVSSLIELGAGFHPDMSGRDNIYINASIFGLTKKEIDDRVEDIIAFSELEEFIDNPVRTYSSGMYMRLAFAVAINVNAEILLIDEILGVGDVAFQAKCFSKLKKIKAQGTTIVIVSHSLAQIEQICERSIWIHEGVIKENGNPRMIHPLYLDYMGEKRQESIEKEIEREELKKKEEIDKNGQAQQSNDLSIEENENAEQEKERWGDGNIRIEKVRLINNKGKECGVFRTGDSMQFSIEYKVHKRTNNVVFGIGVFREDGTNCYGTNTQIDQLDVINIDKDGKILLDVESLELLPGKYTLDVAIVHDDGMPIDYYKNLCEFEMMSTLQDIGVMRIEHSWRFEG